MKFKILICRQENFIDIENELSDENGFLRADFAVDGLHPDGEGKEIIGRAVENWLINYLDSLGNLDNEI